MTTFPHTLEHCLTSSDGYGIGIISDTYHMYGDLSGDGHSSLAYTGTYKFKHMYAAGNGGGCGVSGHTGGDGRVMDYDLSGTPYYLARIPF